jgi:hypothetical protein
LVEMKRPFLERHPAATTPSPPWRPPVSDTVGWCGLNHEEVREAAARRHAGARGSNPGAWYDARR